MSPSFGRPLAQVLYGLLKASPLFGGHFNCSSISSILAIMAIFSWADLGQSKR
jgi:hypothetical protein